MKSTKKKTARIGRPPAPKRSEPGPNFATAVRCTAPVMRVTRTINVPEDASFHELYQVTGREWYEMPTISSCQDADLKYESTRYRVWYSRMHPSDYLPEQVADGTYSNERVQFEELIDGWWIMLDRYGKSAP